MKISLQINQVISDSSHLDIFFLAIRNDKLSLRSFRLILLYITTTPPRKNCPLRLGTSVGYQGIPLDPQGPKMVCALKISGPDQLGRRQQIPGDVRAQVLQEPVGTSHADQGRKSGMPSTFSDPGGQEESPGTPHWSLASKVTFPQGG